MEDLNDKKNQQKPKQLTLKDHLNKFLDNKHYQLFITLATVYSLFSDDIRVISVEKSGDEAFYVLSLIFMICFILEILIASYSRQQYFLTFFFYLDIISTVSMIFDIGWITDELFDSNSGNVAGSAQLARAGRASRVGTKAARIIRIVRLIRLVKLYKQAQQALIEQQLEMERAEKAQGQQQKLLVHSTTIDRNAEQDSNNDQKQLEQFTPQESNVSKRISDLTTKRVICIVMAILLSIPVFDLGTYYEEYTLGSAGLNQILAMQTAHPNGAQTLITTNYYVQQGQIQRNPLIYVKSGAFIWQSPTANYLNLRQSDYQIYSALSDDNVISAFDKREDNKLNAGLGILRTFFVCFILTAGSMFFTKGDFKIQQLDSNDLVLAPIEQMLNKVQKIAKNPLEAAQMEENDAIIQEQMQNQTGVKIQEKKIIYETDQLERTIIKLGALLALGFGEAGSEIIAKNIAQGGAVDPMIPGRKLICIYGFCDIRNFTDATEILQEDVMVFVNEIAEIVHFTCDQFNGAANKNIGDAFLLVWKFPEELFDETLTIPDSPIIQQFADMACISLLKMQAQIYLSKTLKKYQYHPGLNERMPNYRVKLGFGLHQGWSIEGAIGSEFKIDASYLSPNVNMAGRLEAGTKMFGVPLLISGPLVSILSPSLKSQCRCVERVTQMNSNEPLELWTCDLDLKNLEEKVQICEIDKMNKMITSKQDKKKLNFRNRIKRNNLRKDVMSNSINVYKKYFVQDKEIRIMRETFTKEFYTTFEQGFECYSKGKWSEATKLLEKTYDMRSDMKDGPSLQILDYIKSQGGVPPREWKGIRDLSNF